MNCFDTSTRANVASDRCYDSRDKCDDESEWERERERDKTIITGLLNSSLIYTECLNLFFNKLKF